MYYILYIILFTVFYFFMIYMVYMWTTGAIIQFFSLQAFVLSLTTCPVLAKPLAGNPESCSNRLRRSAGRWIFQVFQVFLRSLIQWWCQILMVETWNTRKNGMFTTYQTGAGFRNHPQYLQRFYKDYWVMCQFLTSLNITGVQSRHNWPPVWKYPGQYKVAPKSEKHMSAICKVHDIHPDKVI